MHFNVKTSVKISFHNYTSDSVYFDLINDKTEYVFGATPAHNILTVALEITPAPDKH